MQDPALKAALDLGSNSFHMLLVRPYGHGFAVVERLKEKVQLLSGFQDGRIEASAHDRGLACLHRFAQRLAPLEATEVRAMGTFALRQATNAAAFIAAARQRLGVDVEVISGEQEARLIYRAVHHFASGPPASRLVIDIGGGSTEIAFGHDHTPQHSQSVNIGCVAFKDRYFGLPVMQASGFVEARRAAEQALRGALGARSGLLAECPGTVVCGTSGTVESIQMVLRANGWARGSVTAEAMAKLENAIVNDRWVIEAGLPGLAPDRADIFPAGAAILSACFEVLGIEELHYVDVSLLHGMMCEMLFEDASRLAIDLGNESVEDLARRFAVDDEQAVRVARCAQSLLDQSRPWFDDDPMYARLLAWAARLHEVGMHVNARYYHRHGAYIIRHADMPGLTEPEHSILVLLVRGHRRSLPGLAFQAFDPQLADRLVRLAALLRIAVILERSHDDRESPQPRLDLGPDRLHLQCGAGWLGNHPLSERELQVEADQLRAAGIAFTFE